MPQRTNARSDAARRILRQAVRIPTVATACALLVLAAGGCAGGPKAVSLKDAAEFKSLVTGADKPVLVMFYKGGCASCIALEPTIDQLASEYEGRAVVAKYMILTFTFGVTSPELKEKYGVVFVPHVALLVNGQEKQHWIMEYSIDGYRKALNEAVGPLSAKQSK